MSVTIQYSSSFKNLIWTDHVLMRMEMRKIPQEWAWRAFQYPDKTVSAKHNSYEFLKKIDETYTVSLIAKKNDRKEWIIVSCWIEPPMPGSPDIQKKKEYWKERKQPFMIRLIRSLFSLFIPK